LAAGSSGERYGRTEDPSPHHPGRHWDAFLGGGGDEGVVSHASRGVQDNDINDKDDENDDDMIDNQETVMYLIRKQV